MEAHAQQEGQLDLNVVDPFHLVWSFTENISRPFSTSARAAFIFLGFKKLVRN